MLLGELIEERAKAHPDRPALIFEGREISLSDVRTRVNRVANGLAELGIEAGDRVAIMLPNIPEFVYAFFGVQRLGGVCVPFNTMYKGGEVAHILSDSGARAVIALSNFAPLINELLPDLPDLEHVILTGERNVIFAEPDATLFIQFVVDQRRFDSADHAYRQFGDVLLQCVQALGVEEAWYKHRGSLRIQDKKLATFVIQEVEDLYIASAVVFTGSLPVEEFMGVIWVPQEIKDKVMEPTLSVAQASGQNPAWEEIVSTVTRQVEQAFGIRLQEAGLERDELFGYEKLRTLLGR